jgi:hypothetical protein
MLLQALLITAFKITLKTNAVASFAYNSIQENPERELGDELNADMPSSFRRKPRSLEWGGCHSRFI